MTSKVITKISYAALPFFIVFIEAAAATVHDTWGEDGEENKKNWKDILIIPVKKLLTPI